ncbi:MAG: phosphate ABC transporter permease PstA [Caldilineaceae bacterium]|nr:phosphate ABC transporter permease PstA [Caldilineaceae bacterium]
MALPNSTGNGADYPEGAAGHQQVVARQRTGAFWAVIFMASTLIGIIALVALLYNVINSAFGFVMIQNEIDPEVIVQSAQEELLLNTPNLTTSEDAESLAASVAADPNAIGFLWYAYAQRHSDTLRAVAVEGVEPGAASVESGEYPLARPLFLYSAASVLQENPQAASFLRYYIEHVNDVLEEEGYFPAASAALEANLTALKGAVGQEPESAVGDVAPGDIMVAGSSTLYPLTERMANEFIASGFAGEVDVESTSTQVGLAEFCSRGNVEIVNASRAISRAETEACRKSRRTPLEFRVGNDALAIVVSQENSFLQNVTQEQLAQLFTTAEQWSDVDPSWPSEAIVRYTPGATSGTLNFFVETVLPAELYDLSKETLTGILQDHVSAGLMRRLEHDQPFAERSQANVYELVVERVVEAKIAKSWSLSDSLLRRSEIESEVAAVPNAELTFRSWLTGDFITSPQSSQPEFAGVRTAIFGSLWVILITILFSLPIGVGAAVYLEEYAEDNRFNRLVETNINNLAGVPSIIYGMLGLAIFVRALEPLTSGSLFGVGDPTTANGRTILAAGLTLGLLILPLLIINAREAIRAVPASLRQASYGLGATKWQTVWNHVLPGALPGILTGTILAISRAIGETAPLVVIGASTFIVVDPDGPFSKFTTLPIQIYQWTSRPQAEFRNLAAAAILVLLIMLLSLNATAVILRNRFSRQGS